MKAIVCTRYGPPETLQFAEVAKPIPKDDEVLIKICAASVNPVDRIFRVPYILRILTGLRKPRDARVGRDMTGQVEAVGKNVTRFKSGVEVFGVCRGAFAEYAGAKEDKLALKPV
ncbi:MAG TPA: alcohol dehydrogenase catalytic domain-containing protein, partial [Candidatus Angelobacter sp.]|nr:alcohol dehydrogenase catalytic domain-containing protein [Candidatus Angelobacter sp.]